MANLLLTNRCVRSCPYCFAQRELRPAARGDFTTWEDLIFVADFLIRSGEQRISLLGGEPTLHPEFVDFALYLHERNLDVTVFTSGVMPETTLADCERYLGGLAPGALSFVCNLNDPTQTAAPPGELERVHRFLAVMGPWIMPGFTIYREDFRLEFLFDLVLTYGLRRELRLGVAHPVPGRPGPHIRPDQIRAVIARLYEHRPLFNRLRLKPGLDCGFPLCQFTDEQLGWFQRLTGEGARCTCGSAIDIAPDMSVYACFPLSRFHRRSLYEFTTLREIYDLYDDLTASLRAELPGIYAECDGCVHREEESCVGGGACQLLRRLEGEAPVRLPDIESGLADIRLPERARAD